MALGRYQRPSLDLFNEHCDMVVRKYELDACHIQGHAVGITVPARLHGPAVTVRLADGWSLLHCKTPHT